MLWTPHLETSLEIEDVLRECNVDVCYECFYLNWDVEDRWDLLRKIYRYFSIKVIYLIFRKIKNEGVSSLLRSLAFQIRALPGTGRLDDYSLQDIDDSLYSSAMSVFKASNIDPKIYSQYEKRMRRSLGRFSKWISLCEAQYRPDYIVLFNGRFATSRLIRRFCQNKDIQYIVHERGASKNKYSLWLNSIPHDPKALGRSFFEFVQNSDETDVELAAIGEKFYAQRRSGKNKGWHSFMTEYESEELTALIGECVDQVIVTYFTSTEDEFKALQQDLPPIGPLADQLAAISSVKAICERRGYKFLLRLHPNLANRDASERDKYSYGDHVIEPTDPISSYSLIRSSTVILTHNSQIALEAVALGKPSAYTGRTRFEDLPCVVKCRTQSDLESFISEPYLNDVKFQSCLHFGAYLSDFGISYKYYQAKELNRGSYRGLELNTPFAWIL
tara:strand:+ start:5175 stop:6509 length:1335 start_codon:yes stop_codon:yes gene_type:complete